MSTVCDFLPAVQASKDLGYLAVAVVCGNVGFCFFLLEQLDYSVDGCLICHFSLCCFAEFYYQGKLRLQARLASKLCKIQQRAPRTDLRTREVLCQQDE
jgi:hypothetical protein